MCASRLGESSACAGGTEGVRGNARTRNGRGARSRRGVCRRTVDVASSPAAFQSAFWRKDTKIFRKTKKFGASRKSCVQAVPAGVQTDTVFLDSNGPGGEFTLVQSTLQISLRKRVERFFRRIDSLAVSQRARFVGVGVPASPFRATARTPTARARTRARMYPVHNPQMVPPSGMVCRSNSSSARRAARRSSPRRARRWWRAGCVARPCMWRRRSRHHLPWCSRAVPAAPASGCPA